MKNLVKDYQLTKLTDCDNNTVHSIYTAKLYRMTFYLIKLVGQFSN